jgi:hypothetical protein
MLPVFDGFSEAELRGQFSPKLELGTEELLPFLPQPALLSYFRASDAKDDP